jgi:hypothetical protein
MLAVVFAVFVYWRQDQDARKNHARHVSAWADRRFGVAPDRVSSATSPIKGLCFVVRNGGVEPVYDVIVNTVDLAGAHQDFKLSLVAPNAEVLERRQGDEPKITLTFTDANSVRWRRDPEGRLTELKPTKVKPPRTRWYQVWRPHAKTSQTSDDALAKESARSETGT